MVDALTYIQSLKRQKEKTGNGVSKPDKLGNIFAPQKKQGVVADEADFKSGGCYDVESYQDISLIDPKWNSITRADAPSDKLQNKYGGPTKNYDIKSPELASIIDRACKKYNVDKRLVIEVMRVESRFNPTAVSHCGAKGLMQLMPPTAKSYGVKDAYNPAQNVDAGVHMLSDLLKQYKGDVKKSLAAYNYGSGNVNKCKGNINRMPKETRTYVAMIHARYMQACNAKQIDCVS